MQIGAVKTDDERAAADAALGALQGQRVLAVRYFDLAPDEPGAAWTPGAVAEVQGVELDLEGLGTYAITWLLASDAAGLSVTNRPLVGDAWAPDADLVIADMTGRWRAAGISRVDEVLVAWVPVIQSGPGDELNGLARIELRSEAGTATIDLATLGEDGQPQPSADDLVVRVERH